MQFEIVKSQSVTESLVLVASQIFGKADGGKPEPDQTIKDAGGMAAFIKRLNKRGR